MKLKQEYLDLIMKRQTLKGMIADAFKIQTRQVENIVIKEPERFLRLDILAMIASVAEVKVPDLTEEV